MTKILLRRRRHRCWSRREREYYGYNHQLLHRRELLERDDNQRLFEEKAPATCNRLGSVSNEGSQCNMTYRTDGVFPTFCACTHGYATGMILEEKDN